MTGMTPAWLTLSGRYVEVPPYILRPTMRLAYCTGMRRCPPCSTKTTPMTMISAAMQTNVKTMPPRLSRMFLPSPGGMAEAMLAKINSDMPLPTPRSVASSPIHITSAAPAVITMTITANVVMFRPSPWPWMMSRVQPCSRPPLAASATMLVACRIASAIARYLVYCVILVWPACPLLAQLFEARDDDRQQLHDDARGDVGHDAHREHGQLQQGATGEQVDQRVDLPGLTPPADLGDALLDVGGS